MALSQESLHHLAILGVQPVETHRGDAGTFPHWPALLPLRADGSPPPVDVLFELPGELLPAITGEMLRLGNDRQRYFAAGDGRVFLHVPGPPYYTLLRALDRLDPGLNAYAERVPGVWLPIGFTHPLLDRLDGQAGRMLVITPAGTWQSIPADSFRDIDELLRFAEPARAERLVPAALPDKLPIPLRLTAGNAADMPELWILTRQAIESVDAFVRDADERTRQELLFAVIAGTDPPRVVLRERPRARRPRDLPAWPGTQGYVRYRRLNNLYVPAGTQLRPMLRREMVRQMLAADEECVVWLSPGAEGVFTPESLPDEAFRPLDEWVDLIVSRDREPLERWLNACTFEFDSFLCKGEVPTTNPPVREVRRRPPAARIATPPVAEAEPAPAEPLPRPRTKETREPERIAPLAQAAPAGELKKQLDALEQQFLEQEGPLDAPERQALWPQLARLNAALGDLPEAAICWAQALWERTDLPAAWLSAWYHSEAVNAAAQLSDAELDREISSASPSHADLRRLCARVLYACGQSPVHPALVRKLAEVRAFIDKHSARIGVRMHWLVWRHLTHLSGDALALVRGRDRLLARLYRRGLQRLHDVAHFIHFAGQRDGSRLRQIQDMLLTLRQAVQAWLARDGHGPGSLTRAYADLLFAYGFARMGDERHRLDLTTAAVAPLRAANDPATQFLTDAFEYRIGQAGNLDDAGPLPAELLARLEGMDQQAAYAVGRLRKQLRILDPHERSDPYLQYQRKVKATLSKDLAALKTITDPKRLLSEIRRLLLNAGQPLTNDERLAILLEAIPLTPRLGREAALDMLALALPAMQAPGDMALQARLIQAAVPIAALEDQRDLIPTLLGAFIDRLRTLPEAQLIESINEALGPWLRALRRCGLKNQLDSLLDEMTKLLVKGRTLERLRHEYMKESHRENWPEMLRSLMQIAEWAIYNDGRPRVQVFLDEARLYLFDNDPKPGKKRPIVTRYVPLTTAYLRALSQIDDLDLLASRFGELLEKMDAIPNTQTTQGLYSAQHLSVIETIVLALAGEDFLQGETAKRWLDDDEYLVRRRIHADVAAGAENV